MATNIFTWPAKTPPSFNLRQSRLQNVDKYTVALWRFGKSSLAQPNPNVKDSLAIHDFKTDGKYDAPASWNRGGVSGYKPTFENGIMTMYCYSTPSTNSYIVRNNDINVCPVYSDGFRVRFNWRTSRGSAFSPEEGEQSLYYSLYNGENRIGVHYDGNYVQLSNLTQYIEANNNVELNIFDWNNIEVRGWSTSPGDINSDYVELYLNDELIMSGISASTSSGTYVRIGNSFTNDGTFTTSEIGFWMLQEGQPFLAHPGTNLQGNTNADFPLHIGVGPHKVEAQHDVPFDYAIEFNGSQGYLSNDESVLDLTGAFTIEGWIYADTGSLGASDRIICGKQSLNSSGWILKVGTGKTLQAGFYDSSENLVDSGTTILEGTWYYIALVWTGTYARLYINGDLKTSSSVGYVANSGQPLRFGTYSESVSNYWDGKMADFRYSNIARNAGEIHNVYYALSDPQQGFTIDDNSIAVYNFDEPEQSYGKLSSSSHRIDTSKRIIDFNSTEEFEEFFRPSYSVIGADGYVDVTDGKLRIAVDYTPGVVAYSYVYGYGKNRVVGDFNVSVDLYIDDWVKLPFGYASINFQLVSVCGKTAQILVEQYDPSPATLKIRFYIYDDNEYATYTITVNDDLPSMITLRMARLSNMWNGYYGFDGEAPTNHLGKATGPNSDCIMQFASQIDETHETSGWFYHDWDNIVVNGWNGYEEDGYLVQEIHGLDAYGGTSPSYLYRNSAIGNRARDFNGTSDYCQIPNHAEWNHLDLSVELWFQADTLQDAKLISRLGKGSNAGWHITINSGGTITVEISDSGANTASVSGGSYSALAWHYVAMTFDYSNSILTLYLDGNMVSSSTMPSTTNNFSSNIPIDLGREGIDLGEYFSGGIGAVRISDNVRTPKEIFDYYHGSNIKESK